MLKPATHIPGLKELYEELKAGKILNEMDWSLLGETVFYVPKPTAPDFMQEAVDQDNGLKYKIGIAAMEYGETILKHGASPDYEEKGFSHIDLLKLRVLEGVSRTECDVGELKQFARLSGLENETQAAEMMKLMREAVLKNGIEPMTELEKENYAATTICNRTKKKSDLSQKVTSKEKLTPRYS